MPNGKPKRGDSISVEEDEEEEEEEDAGSPSEQHAPQMNGKKGGSKKPETEEEKRKNFLERNRQGALTDFAIVLNPVISRSDFSCSQVPSAEKGLVGSVTGKERVFDPGESKITRGPRQHTRGASPTFCWGSIDACWCHQSTAKRTSSQRER
jgi:hypothetical protein